MGRAGRLGHRSILASAACLHRVTGGRRIGAFTMHAQVGTATAFAGVAQPHDESVPILVLPGAVARPVGAGLAELLSSESRDISDRSSQLA